MIEPLPRIYANFCTLSNQKIQDCTSAKCVDIHKITRPVALIRVNQLYGKLSIQHRKGEAKVKVV